MTNTNKNYSKSILFSLAILLSTYFTVIKLSAQTSENPFLFGLSIQRLAIISFCLIISIIGIFFLFGLQLKSKSVFSTWIFSLQNDEKIYKTTYWILFIAYLLFLSGNIPSYRTGQLKGYWFLLEPVFTYLSMLLLILFLYWYPFNLTNIKSSISSFYRKNKSAFIIIASIFLAVFGILLFFYSSLPKDQYFWNTAGVPVLPEYSYLIFGLLFFLPLYFTANRKHNGIYLNLSIVVIMIFVITNVVFQQQPITKNYFIETRGEIDIQYFPNSDARYYDVSGQAFINGLGINAGRPADKPLYEAYTGILHILMGDDYKNRVRLNVFILSLIPVFLFGIGKLLDSDEFGFVLSAFSILFEITTFQSSGHIANIHWKVLTPEPMVQLMAILATMTSIIWFKYKDQKKWLYITGMVMAIATLVRPTISFLFPSFLLIILISRKINFKEKLYAIGHSITSFGLTLLPWFVYCYYHYGYIPLYSKFLWIQNSRYSLSAFLFDFFPEQVFQPILRAASSISAITFPDKLYLMFGHFLNNIIKSLLILPYQLTMDKVPTIFTDIHYWSESISWNGQVSIIFLLNLLVFSIGVARLFNKHRVIGLLPLIYMIFYFAALSISRTSGSRYIIPTIWVVYLYYCFGILSITRFILYDILKIKQQPHKGLLISTPQMKLEKRTQLLFLFPLFIGLLFPIVDYSIPLNQKLYLSDEANLEIQNQPWIYEELSISQDEWNQLITDKQFTGNYGKLVDANIHHNTQADTYSITFEMVGNRVLNNGFFTFENITGEEVRSLNLKGVYYLKTCRAEEYPYFSPFMLIGVDQDTHFINHENWQTCYENWKE